MIMMIQVDTSEVCDDCIMMIMVIIMMVVIINDNDNASRY